MSDGNPSYDSSDKTDQPSHPVIFTKRATSIVAHGAEIYPHPDFTQSLDYEGEIGVILGKVGFQVSESDAMDYVWGYTIINDVTAREKQRDHKQFFLGKSADTFCPMGPVAVAKEDLPDVLEVVTRVNGDQRQRGTTADLIFSIPRLVATISLGQTIFPGDVIATGTPAGVGFGFQPPRWLVSGDEVEISVTGLGSLKNRVGSPKSRPSVASSTHVPPTLNMRVRGDEGVASIGGKKLFYKSSGQATGKSTLFIHGLGGTHDYYNGLVQALQSKRALHLFDLEGHGLSPVAASSYLSIGSFAADAQALAEQAGIRSGLTVIAHSMGCLAAMKLAAENPGLVDELVLMGPPPSPLPAGGATATYQRATTVRSQGMNAIAEAVARGGTSAFTQENNPLAFVAVRLSLLGQDPEGYAKACHALADSTHDTIDVSRIQARTLLLTGTEDKVSPPALCEKYNAQIKDSKLVVIDNVAHWHLIENQDKVIEAVGQSLA
jgi:2-keto-4-pentenoate hydratase/2-oxohepta-3-ene-1,7-dioic acid hydratase in catechol pathway/pimeloyl-ACP methyl ester carboxylesterase